MPPARPPDILALARLVSGQTSPAVILPDQWPEIARLAAQHGLGPLLHWQLRQAGASNLPEEARQALERSARIAAFNFRFLDECRLNAQVALDGASVPCTWLKGIAIAHTLYPQPDLRPMDDLDLLVPYDQRQEALLAVQAAGFDFPLPGPLSQKMDAPRDAGHHYHLVGGRQGEFILELHFRLVGDESLLPLREMAWFWEQSEVDPRAGFRVLKPEANFLYLCAHAFLQHGEGDFRLQRYYDLHLLARQAEFHWEQVIDRAAGLGWAALVERALALTRLYFATAVPEPVLAELARRSSPDEVLERARRLEGEGSRWEGTWMEMKKVSARQQVRKIFYLTFPPQEFMHSRYAIPPGRALLPYYIYRWADAGREVLAALGKSLARRLKS